VQNSSTHSMHRADVDDGKPPQQTSHVHSPAGSQLRSGWSSSGVGGKVGVAVGAFVGA
jgi:hypothetical protein